MVHSRKVVRIVGMAVLGALLVITATGCRGLLGRNSGPIDAFAFLPGSNPELSQAVQGVINNRPDPKEIAVVVPPGTDMSRLVASITLNTEASITVISSGRRVPQNSLTPNNFSVPVTYAIELPGEEEPVLYTVRVREASTNARLIELSIQGSNYQTPTFGPTVDRYQAEVPYGDTQITVQARAEDPRAFAISVDGRRAGAGSGEAVVDFSVGDSVEIVVEVVAEDQNTRQEYYVTVVRGEPDRNSNLSSLSVEGSTFDQVFRVDRPNYTTTIPYSATQVSVTALAESEFASLRINGTPATSGAATSVPIDTVEKQTLQIEVTAQDGSTRAYAVTLNRAEPDTNAALSSIRASGGQLTPAFSPDQFSYGVTLPQEQNSVTIAAEAQSVLTTVQSSTDSATAGRTTDTSVSQVTVNLAEGERAVILFTTLAESGASREYRVSVARDIGMASVILSDLVSEGAALTPAFNPQVTEYSIAAAAETEYVRLLATTLDESVDVFVGDELYPGRPAPVDILLYEGVQVETPVTLRAPNGLEREYLITASRPEQQSRIGRRIIQVTMDELRLSRMVAASLTSNRANIDNEARIRVRYRGTGEIIFEDTAAVEFERTRSDVLVTLNYRSPFIDMDLGEYLSIEISIARPGNQYLSYNTVAFADGELDIRPDFMALTDSASMDWPEPGTPRPVTVRTLYQISEAATRRIAGLGDGFVLNNDGEVEVTLRVYNLEDGLLIGTETLLAKPGSVHGRGIESLEGIELPEGSRAGFVMTARTREGRLLRAHGSAVVRTQETFENGEWEFASLFYDGTLELIE